MTSRIHRGFHRIGVVLAVPMFIAALWLGGHEVWDHQTFFAAPSIIRFTMADGTTRDVQAPDVETALRKAGHGPEQLTSGEVHAVKLVPVDYDPWAPGAKPPRTPSYATALLLLALAFTLYAAARAVGWVLDGFMSPRA